MKKALSFLFCIILLVSTLAVSPTVSAAEDDTWVCDHWYTWWETRKTATIFQKGEKIKKCGSCSKILKTKQTAKKKVKKPTLKFNKSSKDFTVRWTSYSGKESIFVRYRTTSSSNWKVKQWKNFYTEDLTEGKSYYIQAQLRVTKKGKTVMSDWSKRLKVKLGSNNSSSNNSSNNSSNGSTTYYIYPFNYFGVYITPYGTKYHVSKSCAGSNAISTTLDSVQYSHDPCMKCAY